MWRDTLTRRRLLEGVTTGTVASFAAGTATARGTTATGTAAEPGADDASGGTDAAGFQPVRPASTEITVQPETPILFEVSARNPLEPGDVEWRADGDVAGDLALAVDYAAETGTAAHLASAETAGTYEVRATVPTETGTADHRWTMHVTPGGRGQPSVEELTTRPSADEVISVENTVEVTVSARDTEGTLDRVLWQEGQNHTVADVGDLAGTQDSTTLAVENPPWIASGYPTMARVVCEDGRLSDVATDDGPEVRPPFAVDITDTTAPVEGGDRLEVTATVENAGHIMMTGDTTQEIELVVGQEPERVDSATVTVAPGTTETVTLGYETYPVARDDTFPVRVESADDADERAVTVSGTGA